jgi:hypothetical protein
MRRISPFRPGAVLLTATLGPLLARADCCDPPVVATSYAPTLYSTSTLVPTAYVAPRVIEPTVYLESPVVYESTGYVVEARRPGLLDRLFGGLGRRSYEYDLVPTAYVETVPVVARPTTFLSPTRYLPTATIIERPVIEVDPCAVPTAAVRTAAQGSATASPQGAAPRPYDGTGAGLGGGDSRGRANEPELDYKAAGANRANGSPSDGSGSEKSSPAASPPLDEPPAPLLDGATSRSAYRPAATELRAQTDSPAAGALRGVVVNASGQPKADVRVVFTDVRQTYRDRERVTDASGRFEVVLPNGDWTVNVQESDGRLTPFGVVTAAGGRFLDDRDRIVSSLRLNH